MTMGDHRSPDQLVQMFSDCVNGVDDHGGISAADVVHDIIADIQDSYTKAMKAHGASDVTAKAVTTEVNDYIANHYGDL